MFRALAAYLYSSLLASLPDRVAIQIQAARTLGRLLDLESGSSFNEKVNRRKLDRRRNGEMAALADKVAVKKHVASTLGISFVTPTIWSGRTLPDAIPGDWPDEFILKLNTGSSANLFGSREGADWASIRRRANSLSRTSNYSRHKEHWYELIEPQWLVEPRLTNPDGLTDYKCFVFHGRVEFFQVDVDRFENHRRVFYNREWTRQNVGYGPTPDDPHLRVPPPPHLDGIIRAAEKLAEGWDFVRVDFYDLPDGPRFGEMTFSPGAGFNPFRPYEFDRLFGSFWRME